MRLFLRINLFLSSLSTIFFLSCSPAVGSKFIKKELITAQEVKPLIDPYNPILYKTKLDLYKQHFSGFILVKQLSPEESHITFVTEIGMRIFDFEIRNGNFKLTYMFDPLNKPKIVKLLEEDMKLICFQHLLNKEGEIYEKKSKRVIKVKESFNYYYELNTGSPMVIRSVKRGSLFTKVNVLYQYDSEQHAGDISLKHKGLVKLKIHLIKLNKTGSQ